jgi:hypothetical protein
MLWCGFECVGGCGGGGWLHHYLLRRLSLLLRLSCGYLAVVAVILWLLRLSCGCCGYLAVIAFILRLSCGCCSDAAGLDNTHNATL